MGEKYTITVKFKRDMEADHGGLYDTLVRNRVAGGGRDTKEG
jgi:hypothetical protein